MPIRYLNTQESAEYRKLAERAREIEDKLESLLMESLTSPLLSDGIKKEVADWIGRADTFKGLSYFLTPQNEWAGGDPMDPNNNKTRAPHIEGTFGEKY
jgi:hypothetical protein